MEDNQQHQDYIQLYLYRHELHRNHFGYQVGLQTTQTANHQSHFLSTDQKLHPNPMSPQNHWHNNMYDLLRMLLYTQQQNQYACRIVLYC